MKALFVPQSKMDNVEVREIPGNGNDFRDIANVLKCQYIETVTIGNWRTRTPFSHIKMVVDESGRYKDGNIMNIRASMLYGFPGHHQIIVGDALLMGFEPYEGDFVSLDDVDATPILPVDFEIMEAKAWMRFFHTLEP